MHDHKEDMKKYKKLNKVIFSEMKNSERRGGPKHYVNHDSEILIEDGILDEYRWFSDDNHNIKILFILKEAYIKSNDESKGSKGKNESLIEWIMNDSIKNHDRLSSTWYRISEWSYGILNTDKTHRAQYDWNQTKLKNHKNEEDNRKWLKEVAIINIKKSRGITRSNDSELRIYAKEDKDYIKRQIKLIKPDVIVCGNTGKFINEIFIPDEIIEAGRPQNEWNYIISINKKKTILLDFYHPGNRKWNSKKNFDVLLDNYQIALNNLKE